MPKQTIIKTKKQHEIMREGGKKLAEVLNILKNKVEPELPTLNLESEFLSFCSKNSIIPACKGYSPYGLPPFPAGLCLSINEESVHCYPKKDKIIKDGDIVTIDTIIKYKGLYVDAAVTVGAGKISNQRKEFLKNTENILQQAISLVKNDISIGLISNTMYTSAKKFGYDVLRDYAGHGIGKTMHEYPNIPCYGSPFEGPKLKTGMTVCIEPLVTFGNFKLVHQENGWETKTQDGADFCQFEHTVLVQENGYEILTSID